MKRTTRRAHVTRVVIGAAFGSFLIAMMPISLVSAHANLENSTPSPSAVLENAPQEIVLDFSEPVSRVDGSIELFDERQRRVDIPETTSPVSDRIEVRELPALDDGLYLVVWRALSQDGHVAEGAFTFQIGVGSSTVSGEDLLEGIRSAEDPAGLGILRHSARILVYLGLSALLGTLALAAAFRLRGVGRVIGLGWCAAVLGTVLHFMVQGVVASDEGLSALVDAGAWSDVSATRLGRGLLARLVLLVLLLGLLAAARRHKSTSATATPVETTWWRSSAALVGAGIVLTLSATGHPSASSPAAVAVAVDAVHLGSVLIWMGGLFVIVRTSSSAEFVHSYSRVATFALPIAVVTGVWQAWHLVDNAADVTANGWGRALVVKTVIVVFTAAMALVARWLVRSQDSAPLRRLVGVEVVSAVAIIVATSFLVSSPPQVTAAPQVVSVSLAQDDIIANVAITPGGVGPNEIHVTVVTPGGTLDPVDGLEIRMTEAASDVPPVSVDVEQLGPNHFLGTVAILQSGEWNFEFLIQVSEARVVRLTTTAVI